MNILAFIPGFTGGSEVVLVFLVILLLFGAKKLPELSRSLGKSLSEFKKGQREGAKSDDEEPKKVDSKSDKED